MENTKIYNRIRGALYGVAVGDALGGPLEFMSAGAIQKQHGRVTEMIGGGWLDLDPGEVTDDTQMTMAVARGIAADPEDPIPAIGKNFIAWYESAPKDVGGCCATAIVIAKHTSAKTAQDWMSVGARVALIREGGNAGNGALMRTIYPAIYYADPEKRHYMTKAIGAMTHDNQESIAICEDYADAVYAAIFSIHPSLSINRRHYTPGADPSGYVVDTWSNVIESILDTETFAGAVCEAVNRGGDADTIGAITGGLAGAYYGYNAIPQRWIAHLDEELREELDHLAELAYEANVAYWKEE